MRVILVPQMRVKLRYQEWWPLEMRYQLQERGLEVITLGDDTVHVPEAGSFSLREEAVAFEMGQMEEFLSMKLEDDDVLFHCDLSFPGIFHSVLAHRRPKRALAFVHATALNAYDLFENIRAQKVALEIGSSAFYDRLLVATAYHQEKLIPYALGAQVPVVCMAGLPNPPDSILPPRKPGTWNARYTFASVARPTLQKVDQGVENRIREISGRAIVRQAVAKEWADYYHFLDDCKFLVITAREETYGYQVVDALLRGCIPIAPRAFSYPELLPDRLLYRADGSARGRAEAILSIASRIEVEKLKGGWTDPMGELRCADTVSKFWDFLAKELKGEWT